MKCQQCNKDHEPNALYWHNYKIVGFFCKKCFHKIVKITGSGVKLQ